MCNNVKNPGGIRGCEHNTTRHSGVPEIGVKSVKASRDSVDFLRRFVLLKKDGICTLLRCRSAGISVSLLGKTMGNCIEVI